MMARRRVPAYLVGVGVLVAIFGGGCAASHPRIKDGRAIPRDHPRVAVLPLENLSNSAEAGEIMTRIFWTEIVRSGAFEVIEPGVTDLAMDALQIRSTGSLTADQLRGVGDTLGVGYVFLGSVLESGKIQTSEGDVPAVGVSLRMVETRTAHIVWAAVHVRTGDDRETVFGWGRVRSYEQLAMRLAGEMLEDFRKVGRSTRPFAETTKGAP